MIKVNKDKLEQVILNTMSDMEINNFSNLEVCICEVESITGEKLQVIVNVTRDDESMHCEVTKDCECVTDALDELKEDDEIKINTIQCTRVRACKWQGNKEDLVKVVNKKETKKYCFEVNDSVCPKCGCKTMYDL